MKSYKENSIKLFDGFIELIICFISVKIQFSNFEQNFIECFLFGLPIHVFSRSVIILSWYWSVLYLDDSRGEIVNFNESL